MKKKTQKEFPWHLRLTELENSGGIYKNEVLALVNDWLSFNSLAICGDNHNYMPEYEKKMIEDRANLPIWQVKRFLNSTNWDSIRADAFHYQSVMTKNYYEQEGVVPPEGEIDKKANAHAEYAVGRHCKRVNKFIDGVEGWAHEVDEVDALCIRLIAFGLQEFPCPD